MSPFMRSIFGRRPNRKARGASARRWRPVVEALEERRVPSVSFSGSGNTGVATITGTPNRDQFEIRLKAGDDTTLQFVDNGTVTDASLAGVTGVVVNGLQGNDTLTINNANGLVASTASGGLSISFDGGTSGVDTLILTGDPGVGVTETYAAGANASSGTLTNTSGTASQVVRFTNVSAILDTGTADTLTINLNDNPNSVRLTAGPTVGGADTLRVLGVNRRDVDDGPDEKMADPADADQKDHGGGDQGDDHDDTEDNLADNRRDETGESFVPVVFANKAAVTLNTLGGDDFVVLNDSHAVTGLTSLTIDGGAGTDVLALRHLPPGVTVTPMSTPNANGIERVVVDDDDAFIEELFEQRLGREADDGGLAFWRGVLQSQGQMAVVDGIERSGEAREHLVHDLFHRFLRRDADDGGLEFFTDRLRQGEREEDVLAAILGSQEFLNLAEAQFPSATPNEAFVRELYLLVLNRTASADEVNGWLQQLPANAPAADRARVALAFVESQEFHTDLAFADYTNLLHRGADRGGINFFASARIDLLHLRETFEASDEFLVNG